MKLYKQNKSITETIGFKVKTVIEDLNGNTLATSTDIIDKFTLFDNHLELESRVIFKEICAKITTIEKVIKVPFINLIKQAGGK